MTEPAGEPRLSRPDAVRHGRRRRGFQQRAASSPLTWAVVGAGLQLALALVLMSGQGGPAWLIHFGSSNAALPLAHRTLGPSVPTPLADGEDGVDFWVLARDPLLVHASDVKGYISPAPYRSDRIGYPLLAAPWRAGGEKALVWGLLITNLLAVGAGTWAAARLARDFGGKAWACIAFALCPGVAVATIFDTGDTLALACLMLAAIAVRRRRWGWAIAAAAAAALTKEIAIIGIAGLAIIATGIPLRQRLRLLVIPTAAFGAWALYVRTRLGWAGGGTHDLTAPFSGFFKVLFRHGTWATNTLSKELAVLALLIAAAVVAAWWRRRTLILAMAVPFAVVTPFLGPFVLGLAQNSLRVFAPLLTLAALEVFVWASARSDGSAGPAGAQPAVLEPDRERAGPASAVV